MTVTAQYAAEHFEELVSKVDAGESVVITRPGLMTLRLATAPSLGKATEPLLDGQGRRVLGSGKGHLRQLSDQEWVALDREFEHTWDDPSSPNDL